jgi:hypothetical protein
MKLTRTGTSSSSAGNSGSGVSKASGGRTFPHLGNANGSETGLNSEICAGTRHRRRSDSARRAHGGLTRIGTTGVHQAATHEKTTRQTSPQQARTPPARILQPTHCDKIDMIRLWDVSIVELVVDGLRFLIPLPGRHTAAPEAWQFARQSTNSSKINVLNNLAPIHPPSLQLQLQWIANELKSMAEGKGGGGWLNCPISHGNVKRKCPAGRCSFRPAGHSCPNSYLNDFAIAIRPA